MLSPTKDYFIWHVREFLLCQKNYPKLIGIWPSYLSLTNKENILEWIAECFMKQTSQGEEGYILEGWVSSQGSLLS